ncbi:MAG TPA: glycosyltransferase family 4 protein [Thermoanaerobaculia bacterium]|nr:glycosyltransferase family 4 protein [Thermoanaerobaculia bacterium]
MTTTSVPIGAAILRGEQGPLAVVLSGKSLAGSGGAERRFFRLWAYLVERGIDCLLITNASLLRSAERAGIFTKHGGKEHVEVVDDSFALSRALAIYRVIRRRRCRLIHLPLAAKRLIPLYALLQVTPGIRVTHTVTASYFAHKVPVSLGTRLLSRWLWSMSDRIDSLYHGFLNLYAEPLGFASKVSVSPCSFTDIEKYSRTCLKEDLIVFAGALVAEKNPLLLIEALGILSAAGVRFRAIVAGSGPLAGAVAARTSDLALSDRVEIGAFPDMSDIFCRSSIFVSLQQTENYPSQSLLEAMAARNAVVATAVGETGLLVRHGETGLLVGSNASELAEALKELLGHPRLREKMAIAAQSLIMREHRLERFADYMIAFWADALA